MAQNFFIFRLSLRGFLNKLTGQQVFFFRLFLSHSLCILSFIIKFLNFLEVFQKPSLAVARKLANQFISLPDTSNPALLRASIECRNRIL